MGLGSVSLELANAAQLASAISLTRRTHARLAGSLYASSSASPRCSAHSDSLRQCAATLQLVHHNASNLSFQARKLPVNYSGPASITDPQRTA